MLVRQVDFLRDPPITNRVLPGQDTIGARPTPHMAQTRKPQQRAIGLRRLIGIATAHRASKNIHRLAPQVLDETR